MVGQTTLVQPSPSGEAQLTSTSLDRSHPNGKDKVQYHASHEMPRWYNKLAKVEIAEIETTDIKTRKLFTVNGTFYHKSSTLRISKDQLPSGKEQLQMSQESKPKLNPKRQTLQRKGRKGGRHVTP